MTLWNFRNFDATTQPASYGKSYRGAGEPNPGTAWTDERVERLKKLWTDGVSASIIASDLGGGLSRNAVIGKAHRMHLESRKTVTFRARGRSLARSSTPRPRRPKAPRLSPVVSRVLERMEIPVPIAPSLENRVLFINTDNQHCRYPLWVEDTPASQRFCCGDPHADMNAGRPYCPFHAFRTTSKRTEAA